MKPATTCVLHIPKGIVFCAALLLLFFYVVHRLIDGCWRLGAGWGVRGVDDWCRCQLLFMLSLLFFADQSGRELALSRHLEHQADQYGLEVTHGLTSNAGQVAAQAFQVLGEVHLADPNPNPLNVFCTTIIRRFPTVYSSA